MSQAHIGLTFISSRNTLNNENASLFVFGVSTSSIHPVKRDKCHNISKTWHLKDGQAFGFKIASNNSESCEAKVVPSNRWLCILWTAQITHCNFVFFLDPKSTKSLRLQLRFQKCSCILYFIFLITIIHMFGERVICVYKWITRIALKTWIFKIAKIQLNTQKYSKKIS